MSCSSIKHRFDQLNAKGGIEFTEAVHLFNDLKGSLDAHKLELAELSKTNNKEQIDHIKHHIREGEEMLSKLESMTLH